MTFPVWSAIGSPCPQSHRRYLAEHRFQTPLFDTPGLVRDLETQLEALVAGTLSEA